ncbi:hypothetical protein FHL15_010838 [Xylaria flabelliformis]|uniref:C2H2-type domain-containing protein n=1 Tax=Xylaria flabelliformis TaxID=2512241 RepID=A0A553HJZ4_9PEZI|nr:hypothetical protein FHL15_010838 [Xylaria flabelliformis]
MIIRPITLIGPPGSFYGYITVFILPSLRISVENTLFPSRIFGCSSKRLSAIFYIVILRWKSCPSQALQSQSVFNPKHLSYRDATSYKVGLCTLGMGLEHTESPQWSPSYPRVTAKKKVPFSLRKLIEEYSYMGTTRHVEVSIPPCLGCGYAIKAANKIRQHFRHAHPEDVAPSTLQFTTAQAIQSGQQVRYIQVTHQTNTSALSAGGLLARHLDDDLTDTAVNTLTASSRSEPNKWPERVRFHHHLEGYGLAAMAGLVMK